MFKKKIVELLYDCLRWIVFPNKGITHIKRSKRLVVSLTSHPGRIHVVEHTIDSLLRQSIKPDSVVLWLEESKFPCKDDDLPKSLKRYRKFGLEIKWYSQEIRSYCKLIPELRGNPHAVIVTADDDVLYQEDWLEKLYVSYLKYPNEIHCHHAYNYYTNRDGSIASFCPYNESGLLEGSVVPMGVGGVLYPPHIFKEVLFDEELFRSIAPTNDDFWFWAMAKVSGVRSRQVDGYIENIICADGTQDSGLWESENKIGAGSLQFKNIITHFPELRSHLLFV